MPFGLHSRSVRDSIFFDIKVNGTEDNIILIKGKPDEAPPVLLSGVIELTIGEPTKLKSVSVRLVGKMKFNVPVTPDDKKVHPGSLQPNSNQRNLIVDKVIYQHKWDDFGIDKYFKNLYSNYSSKIPINECTPTAPAMNDLKRMKSRSTTSLTSMLNSSNTKAKYHTLVKGGYEFPFSTILPGSINESVDGLPNTTVEYYIEASIERPHGKPDLYCRKYIRIVRTVAPDSMEISETVNVSDHWPNKIDYSISIPAKAIPIGSEVPLEISIIPLIQNLKLGPIRIILYENIHYFNNGVKSKQERIVSRMKIMDPEAQVIRLTDDDKFQEKWELNFLFKIPADLSLCVQDCKVLNNLRITHKIRFIVCLINPDGHESYLKTSATVRLFISEFIPLAVKPSALYNDRPLQTPPPIGQSGGSRSASCSDHLDPNSTTNQIFRRRRRGASETWSNLPTVDYLTSNRNSNYLPVSAMRHLLAPPEYQRHMFDRVCSSSLPIWNNEILLSEAESAENLVAAYCTPAPVYQDTGDLSAPLDETRVRRRRGVSDVSCFTVPDILTSSSNGEHDNTSSLMFNIDDTTATTGDSSVFLGSNSPLKFVEPTAGIPPYDNVVRSDMFGDDLPPAYSASQPSLEPAPPSPKPSPVLIPVQPKPIAPIIHVFTPPAPVAMTEKARSYSSSNPFVNMKKEDWSTPLLQYDQRVFFAKK